MVVNIALKEVMKITKNQISIGDIRLKPFYSLKLSDVYVGDLKNDTLLYVKELSTDFSLWSLLSSKLQINSVEINDFTIHLNADSVGGDLNFQFFIDAFSSDKVDTTASSPLIINLDNIALVNGKVSYNILSETPVHGEFDYNHIHIDSLQLATAFSFTSVEDFMVKLKHLSLKESSGLNLQELTANIKSENKRMELNDFVFRLTKSELRIDSAYIDYSNTTFDKLATNATFRLPISKFVLYPFDAKMFYPPLEKMKDSLVVGLDAEGKLPAVNLDYFYLIFGRAFSLDASAFIEDYTNWDSSPIELNIAQLLTDTRRLARITKQLSADGIGGTPIELPVNTDILNLRAFLKGVLPDLQINLNLITSSGQLALNGRGGYVYATGDTHVDATLKTEDLNLALLLANPVLGITSLNAAVKGSMSGNGKLAATLNAAINRFDYNGYSYNKIQADALYANDSIRLLAEITDSIVPLWLSVRGANISTENPYIYLEAKARHILFDSLNLIPQYKGADLYTDIQAEIQNFDLDRIKAAISIDSLSFKTDSGTFYQDSIRIRMENEEGGYKSINISSPLLEAAAYGTFSFARLPISLSNSLSKYFTAFIPYQEVDSASNDDINLYVLLRNTENLSSTLGLPVTIPDSAMVSGYYNNKYNNVLLSAAIPKLRMGESELLQTVVDIDNDTLAPRIGIFGRTRLYQGTEDTIRLFLGVRALGDSANLRAFAGDPSKSLELYAFLDSDAHFTAREDGAMPLVDASLNRGAIFVNRQRFNIMPSTIQIDSSRYVINNFELADTSGGNLKINGRVSSSNEDTLNVAINQLYLSSIMAALRYGINLKGTINADIMATEILSNPIVSTNYLNINDISLNNKQIGNLEIGSSWDHQHVSAMLDAELWQANGTSSRINGYIYPTQNRLSLNANMRELELDWLEPITSDYLFGLSGTLGLDLSVEGALDNPTLNGAAYFNKANLGVKMTNVQYKMTDTISISPARIAFNQFKITDNLNNTATITGNIKHNKFSNFDFGLNMRLRDFLVLNNPRQIDSTIYGTLGLNGTIDITGSDKNLLAKATISNSGSGKLTIQLPESARTAQEYTGITYINAGNDTVAYAVDGINKIFETLEESSFPVRVELALTLTPQLTTGMVLNAAAGDVASVSGSGNIQFTYDTKKDEMSMYGDYTIDKGSAAFSFQNLLKRQFQLAKGGKVTFRGDPMASRFTATAIYSLRADLATLDESFSSDPYLSSTRVTVNCLISISGDLNQMTMSYDIQIPGVDESVQRKIEGLLYNDELKIKQIAYLLALGQFYPPDGVVGSSSNAWSAILSSTLSTQLNSLLSNVLNENWSVGTELRTGESGSDDLEANVMVSANLFNNRVTVTTNLGYKNTATANDDFTGDFSVEYKVTDAGDWVIKVYNVTNDQYYEQAPTTQGVGVVYKKEAKTFKELFKKRRRRGAGGNRDGTTRQRPVTEQQIVTIEQENTNNR